MMLKTQAQQHVKTKAKGLGNLKSVYKLPTVGLRNCVSKTAYCEDFP